ncbi:metallophosphoesterase [Lentilactobacillus kisonensis]|uniref:Phosphoesterase n=2 Tax=Lentilactobacillus kisonensis TaxID=481722 RepID=H1LJL7_9LACO|nr:metallophosphoesterase [Lentilactobacillus kisonensis]EHO48589.1 phosphodiesterase family protein [Lentilactobacillus kisonensis F0435]KRL21841.1 phosphodiesterase family protein [Lentilactobacillus kisonensis DSM 19906 = JCM 15041]
MKIVAVSDNHGDRKIIEAIVDKYAGNFDGIFHCGDSEFSQDDPLINKLHIVVGNMDFSEFPTDETSRIDDEQVLVTHGHLQDVNNGLLNLELFARSKNATIVLFGHTHQLGVTQDNGVLFVNPGSISYPRGQYASIGGTYAVITADAEHYQVQYYSRSLEPVNKLQFLFTK